MQKPITWLLSKALVYHPCRLSVFESIRNLLCTCWSRGLGYRLVSRANQTFYSRVWWAASCYRSQATGLALFRQKIGCNPKPLEIAANQWCPSNYMGKSEATLVSWAANQGHLSVHTTLLTWAINGPRTSPQAILEAEKRSQHHWWCRHDATSNRYT